MVPVPHSKEKPLTFPTICVSLDKYPRPPGRKSVKSTADVYPCLLIAVVIAGPCQPPVLGFARRQPSSEQKHNPKAGKVLGFFCRSSHYTAMVQKRGLAPCPVAIRPQKWTPARCLSPFLNQAPVIHCHGFYARDQPPPPDRHEGAIGVARADAQSAFASLLAFFPKHHFSARNFP